MTSTAYTAGEGGAGPPDGGPPQSRGHERVAAGAAGSGLLIMVCGRFTRLPKQLLPVARLKVATMTVVTEGAAGSGLLAVIVRLPQQLDWPRGRRRRPWSHRCGRSLIRATDCPGLQMLHSPAKAPAPCGVPKATAMGACVRVQLDPGYRLCLNRRFMRWTTPPCCHIDRRRWQQFGGARPVSRVHTRQRYAATIISLSLGVQHFPQTSCAGGALRTGTVGAERCF